LAALALLTLIVLHNDQEYSWFGSLRITPRILFGAVVVALVGYIVYGMRVKLQDTATQLMTAPVQKAGPSRTINQTYLLMIILVVFSAVLLAILHAGSMRGKWLAFSPRWWRSC